MWGLTEKQKAELDSLKSTTGNVKPEDVVEFAKNKKSALHIRFDWDDTEAARKWRIVQARDILRVYVIVHSATQMPCKAFVSLSSDRGKAGPGYTAIARVMSDADKRAEMLHDALNELASFRRKYERLTELSEVFAAIDDLTTAKRRKVANAAFE